LTLAAGLRHHLHDFCSNVGLLNSLQKKVLYYTRIRFSGAPKPQNHTKKPAKMAEKSPRFGGPWAGMVKLGAGVDKELGGLAPHQCR